MMIAREIRQMSKFKNLFMALPVVLSLYAVWETLRGKKKPQ